MVRQQLKAMGEWFNRVITEPRSELTRLQRATRFVADLFRHGTRQLKQHRATQMAAALSFRTLFGLIPVLVVGTVLVRAFRGTDQFFAALERMLIAVGLDQITVTSGEVESTGATWLLNLASQAQVVNLAAIGWAGVAVLAYSAIGLMGTIENSFNTIYRAPAGRSWTRRVPMYWTVLTLGPLAMGLTFIVNNKFHAWIETVDTWQWLLAAAPVVWGFAVLWLLTVLVYKVVPNTTVSLKSALAGAFVTAVLVELGRRSLGAYLQNAVSLRQLSGSLGFVPLFMFWVYLMWLVVLFGLEVAATLQMLGGRHLDELESEVEPTGMVDPASVVLVMEVVVDRFHQGKPTSARGVAELTEIAEPTVSRMFDQLVERGLLHRLEHDENLVGLARPPEKILASELVGVGLELVQSSPGARRSDRVRQLHTAQASMASEMTLATTRG